MTQTVSILEDEYNTYTFLKVMNDEGEMIASIRCPQNNRLYEKLGYVRFKEIKTGNNGFVYLEKL